MVAELPNKLMIKTKINMFEMVVLNEFLKSNLYTIFIKFACYCYNELSDVFFKSSFEFIITVC